MSIIGFSVFDLKATQNCSRGCLLLGYNKDLVIDSLGRKEEGRTSGQRECHGEKKREAGDNMEGNRLQQRGHRLDQSGQVRRAS